MTSRAFDNGDVVLLDILRTFALPEWKSQLDLSVRA
jgi:hypothetical protein